MKRKIILISTLLFAVIIFPGCKKDSAPGGSCIPIADFTYVITDSATRTFAFTNASSSNAENFLWQFGDGSTSSLISPQHSYSDHGEFKITLTASGFCGANTKSQTIRLY